MVATNSLTLDQLRATHSAGGLAEVVLRADGGVFYIAVTTRAGGDGLLVKTRTRQARSFTDPRKAMAVLHEIGILSARLDTARWTPDAPPPGKARPDRAAAMRRTQQAVLHDAWFRSEVEQGLRELADPGAVSVTHDEVADRWSAKRAALLKRVGETP